MKQKLKSAEKVLPALEHLVKKGALIRIRIPRQEPDLIASRLSHDFENWETVSSSQEIPKYGQKVPTEMILKHINTGTWLYWGSPAFIRNNFERYGLHLYASDKETLKQVRKLLYEPLW